jgi:hypothetical protein
VYLLQYGYAVIDLKKLDPINVDDLCLSQYLAYILQVYTKFAIFCLGVLVLPLTKNSSVDSSPSQLQFVSQRHKPVRGRSARLLMNYIRSMPCKVTISVLSCKLLKCMTFTFILVVLEQLI